VLNFIYYPVSAILWFWHQVFGFVLGANNGFAWALSVIFLVFTLRTLLIKPFIGQVRSMRKMQEFSPQIKKLQEKYKGDKTKLAEEMQKLQKEHGVNPLGGCLPVLVQLPVFIGLFHVLRGFQPSYPYNYVFDREEILSFLDADIFGVRLSDSILGGQAALGHFSLSSAQFNPSAIVVCLPLMIVASVATHFTARVSQQHQSPAAAANPQAAIMGRLTMWLFPLGVLVFGAFFPVAILLYWLSNNSWTLTQQYLVYNKIAREDEEKRVVAREQRDMLAPKPGQKPQRQRGGGDTGDAVDTLDADSPAVIDTAVGDDEPQDAVREVGRTPAPGARPARNGAKKGASSSGRAAPGKVGSSRGGGAAGSGKNGASGNGAGGNGAANGSGANGKRGGKGRPCSGNATPGKVKSGGGKNGSARNGSGKKKS
jgi:YidC/Oxa1 family membrane protein insertase